MNKGHIHVPMDRTPEYAALYKLFNKKGASFEMRRNTQERYYDCILAHPDFSIEGSEPLYKLVFNTYYDGYNHVTYIAQLVVMVDNEETVIKVYDRHAFDPVIPQSEQSEEEFFEVHRDIETLDET